MSQREGSRGNKEKLQGLGMVGERFGNETVSNFGIFWNFDYNGRRPVSRCSE